MPTTVQLDLGKRERSSATLNFVLMAVPARADRGVGLMVSRMASMVKTCCPGRGAARRSWRKV